MGQALVEARDTMSQAKSVHRAERSGAQRRKSVRKGYFSHSTQNLEERHTDGIWSAQQPYSETRNSQGETAKQNFKGWYEKVASCTLREIKSVRDTIRFYEDEVLSDFDGRKTNASAESLNSKIKCFRAQVKKES